jgi:hypothetical protein
MFEALVAFERSGRVRQALRDIGIDAWSCDLVPADDDSPHHIVGDALTVMNRSGRLLIAHPPCTRLTLAGVRWLHERELWSDLDDACAMFRACLEAPFTHIAVENPTPHKHAVERIGRTYDAVSQPWEHGHGETKRTCWWLKGLPPLLPSNVVEGREGRVWKMPPGPDRARLRSETLPGVAAAIADQWGPFARVQEAAK